MIFNVDDERFEKSERILITILVCKVITVLATLARIVQQLH